jgi:hypothetical protein
MIVLFELDCAPDVKTINLGRVSSTMDNLPIDFNNPTVQICSLTALAATLALLARSKDRTSSQSKLREKFTLCSFRKREPELHEFVSRKILGLLSPANPLCLVSLREQSRSLSPICPS